jgi:signal transduction histidine kinase
MAESLAHIEQNRREFLANVSHELKTPVASIQALAEALHDGMVPDEDKRRRYLSTIVSQSQHIDSIIRDLLDLAQLEAGELSIVIGKVDLGTFLPTELTKYDHRAAEKNVSLALELPTSTPAVLADSMRLSQIMANLITNAIRHAPADTKVSVTVRPTRTAVEVTVSDQGPGIPLEAQPYVWDRFYRVDNSRARSEGGTGLGLSITRRLVEAMGGIITLASVPGKGASFTFTLPIEA